MNRRWAAPVASLRTTSLRSAVAAAKVGYSNFSHFKAYKKVGHTPGKKSLTGRKSLKKEKS